MERDKEIKINGDVKNLLKSIAEVIKEVKNIPKKGHNETMKYNYVMEKDVVEKLREQLTSKGIVIIPNIIETSEREICLRNSQPSYVSKVVMSFTFFDVNTGGSITIYGVGEGQDSLDKGIYKAITGCQKYVLLKTFMIPTGDDPEEASESEKSTIYESKNNSNSSGKTSNINNGKNKNNVVSPEAKIPEKIAKQIYSAAVKSNKLDDVLKKFNYNSTYDIKYKDLTAIKKYLAI